MFIDVQGARNINEICLRLDQQNMFFFCLLDPVKKSSMIKMKLVSFQ